MKHLEITLVCLKFKPSVFCEVLTIVQSHLVADVYDLFKIFILQMNHKNSVNVSRCVELLNEHVDYISIGAIVQKRMHAVIMQCVGCMTGDTVFGDLLVLMCTPSRHGCWACNG